MSALKQYAELPEFYRFLRIFPRKCTDMGINAHIVKQFEVLNVATSSTQCSASPKLAAEVEEGVSTF